MMNPAFSVLANRSLIFGLYDFHLSGISAQELAASYQLPLLWVEERLEAARLCLKFQVRLVLGGSSASSCAAQRAQVLQMPAAG